MSLPPAGTNQCQSLNINRWCTASCLQNLGFTMKALLLLFLLCVVRADDPWGIKELLLELKSSMSTMEGRLSTMEGHLKRSLGRQDSGYGETSHNIHSTISVSTPRLLYTCPEGASIKLECTQMGAALHQHDVIKRSWLYTPHSDQHCNQKTGPRNTNMSARTHPSRGVKYGVEKENFWVELQNVTIRDQGRYCCMSLDIQVDHRHGVYVQKPHSHVILHITPRRNGSLACTLLDPKQPEVHGSYSEWMEWGPCSVSCGAGTQSRLRQCNNPPPANGGRHCAGVDTEQRCCHGKPCPVHGSYSEWMEWGPCNVSCGAGTQSRLRQCNNPPPANGGCHCAGVDAEERSCQGKPCPVDGNWSEWSSWEECSHTCGQGTRTRVRTCSDPPAQHGGRPCEGKAVEAMICSGRPCPVEGKWSSWESWAACSVSCGRGSRQRTRLCASPAPQHGGRQCEGNDVINDICNSQPCPKLCPSGWTKFADKCYYRIPESKTWQQSRDYCLSQAADLLIVNSKKEQVFIRGLSTGLSYGPWIGLIRTEGRWAWLDGSPLTTTYWHPGLPLNDEVRNCAYYNHFPDPGTWANHPCSSAQPAICEK